MHYYGFYEEDEIENMIRMIFDEANKARRKIRIIGLKKAGDIGAYKYRYRADFKVLN